MPFDLSSAAPVDAPSQGGFDLASAKPVAAPKQPTARSTKGQATPIAGIEDVGGEAYNMARGAIMGPLGNVAGLASIPLHAAGAISTPPIDVQRKVASAGAYTPQTGVGRTMEKFGPSAMIGKAAEAAGGAVEKSPIFAGHPIAASLAGYGTKGAIEQAPMALGAKLGGKIAEGIPGKQAALDVQKGLNAPADAIRAQSKGAGLVTPPEGTSWLAGIPGMAKVDRWISAENQPEFNRIIAEQFKLPKGTALSKPVLANVRAKAGEAYQKLIDSGYGEEVTEKQPPKVITSPLVDERGRAFTREEAQPDVTRIPGLPLGESFKAPLRSTLETITPMIQSSPLTFGSLRQSAALLREFIKKPEMEPREAIEAIKTLRADAQTGFKSIKTNDRQAAFTRQEIANRLEDAFEANLQDQKLLNEFRQARKTIAMSYAVEKAIDRAGNVDAQKLAALGERRPLTENLKLVADYASQFPRGAKRVTEGKQAISPFDWIFAAYGLGGALMGHPGALLAPALEMAGRVSIPYAATKGLLSKRTPSYEVGKGRRGLPYALPAAGAAISGQLDQPPQ